MARINFSVQLKICFKHRDGGFSGFASLTGFLLTVPLQCSCKRFGSTAACLAAQSSFPWENHTTSCSSSLRSHHCNVLPPKNPPQR